MRTQEETRQGLNRAFAWLQAAQLRYQVELTATQEASRPTLSKLAEARRIYQTWVVGSDQGRQRRQAIYDAGLTRAAQASPRPWAKPKRKRTRKRARPAPQTDPLPGLGV